jgi:hypothetical protein
MARKSPEGSMSGWFRKAYEADRRLLRAKTNDSIWELWKSEHPGEPITKEWKGAQANIKSVLRKKYKIGPYRGRGGRKPQAIEGAAGEGTVRTVPRQLRLSSLERLELMIDNCLTMAREQSEQDREEAAKEHLEEAVKHLRAARNRVVQAQG